MVNLSDAGHITNILISLYQTEKKAQVYEVIQVFLESLHTLNVKPQKYSLSDDPKSSLKNRKYDQSEILDEIIRSDSEHVEIISSKERKLNSFFHSHGRPEANFDALFKEVPSDKWGEYFRELSKIIPVARPLYGALLLRWDSQSEQATYWNAALNVKGFEFRRGGPKSLSTRTWFREDLVKHIDLEAMRAVGAEIENIPGYGVQIDLLPQPWQHSFEELYSQLEKLNRIFDDSGLKGKYSQYDLTGAGPEWKNVMSSRYRF